MAESESAGGGDFYDRVYRAERPELFYKASPHRVSGPNAPVRIRRDSKRNVPEPELALLISPKGKILGYTAPNGCVLLTGTGIVPPDSFTLAVGDRIEISIDGIGTRQQPTRGLPPSAPPPFNASRGPSASRTFRPNFSHQSCEAQPNEPCKPASLAATERERSRK